MSHADGLIAVFGATGRQGGSVVKTLIEAGRPARAVVRDAATPSARRLRDAGVEIAEASLDDPGAIRAAIKGAYGVFSVLPGALPDGDEVRFGTAIADAAAAGGIGHLVYSSGASAGETPTGVARFDAKPRIEMHVRGLPIPTTIVRPMIFMEMLLVHDYGLAQGRFSFFMDLDQSIQLVAVDDIGRLVAAVFADRARFAGETLRLASDTVRGRDLEAALTEAAGLPIAYAPFSREFLANSPDLAHMAQSLKDGPLSKQADLNLMRELDPELLTLRAWLAGSGRAALDEKLGRAAPIA